MKGHEPELTIMDEWSQAIRWTSEQIEAERRRRVKRILHVLLILAGMVLAQVPAAIWPGTALAVLGLIGGVAVMVWSALHIIGVLGATEVPRS